MVISRIIYSFFLVSDILLLLFSSIGNINDTSFSVDLLSIISMAFFFFFGDFQVPSPVQLTCSAARAPVPVCPDTGCVMVKGTVQMEVMSSPQRAVVWTCMGLSMKECCCSILRYLLLQYSPYHPFSHFPNPWTHR